MGRQRADGEPVDVSRVRAEIDLYGWALQYVESDDEREAFGYTAGLGMRGLPEIVVRGLSPEDTWAVLNDLAEDCTSDRVPQPGDEITGMVPGTALRVRSLEDTTCLSLAHALADGGPVEALLVEPGPVPAAASG